MNYDYSVIALRGFLIGLLLVGSATALAQTSVTNEAFVTPPTTVIDPILSNNQDAETNPVVPFAPVLVTTKSLTSNADEDGSGNVTLGDTLTYTLTVTNTGNVTLTGVTLADSLIAPLNCVPAQPAVLDPTEQLVCTGNYVVQPGDVTAGQIVNTATGDSDQTGPDNDQVTTPVFGPEVSVSKAANPVSGSSVTAGQTITYTLTAVISDAPLTAALNLNDTLDADLTFGSVTNAGTFTPNTTGNPLVFTLPSGTTPGSYSVSYTATVNNDATGTVGNSVIITGSGGDPDPQCPSCSTSHPLADPQVSVTKISNPASGTNVTAGQTVTYTLTATITDAALTAALDLSDTLDADLTFGSVTNAGAFSANTAGNPLVFTLPSGTTPGSYSLSYTATVNNDAAGTVGNSVIITGSGGDPDPQCPSCSTSHPLADPQIVVNKASDPVSGSSVTAGQTITYTLTAVVTDAALTSNLDLSDTLDADLSFGSVTNAGAFSANTAGNPLVFTLPSGTIPGSYSVTYTATVNDDATGTVGNSVVITGPGGDPDPQCPSCSTSHPLADPQVSVTKVSNPASGTNVTAGQTITYTLTATITDAALTAALDLSDTLDADLTFGAVTNAGSFTPNTAGNPLVFTLPSGTTPGSYSVTYTATVNNDATGTVGNSVVITGPGGDPDPQCPSCSTSHPLADPQVSVTKVSDPISGSQVSVGQTIAYTLTAVVTDAALTSNLDLSDTLDADLTFGSVTNAGAFMPNTAGNPLAFTLPSGTTPGSYAVTYTAMVNADATGTVGNSVVITGSGGDPDPECPSCATSHPLADPQVSVTKASDPVSGTQVSVGQTISYTLTAVVTDAALTSNLNLSDTLDADLTFGSVTNAGAFTPNTAGNPLVFTLPSGTTPGSYAVTYTATVNDDATGTVGNSVVITGSGGDPDPQCPSCSTNHPVGIPDLLLVKQAVLDDTNGNGFADAGEDIDYTLTATNTGNVPLTDVTITDPLIGTLNCTPNQPATLAPTELLVCTGSYTVTQPDVDAGGSIVNTATALAPDPFDPVNNPPLTDEDSTSTPVVLVPALTLVKAAQLDDTNSNTFADVGETINYALTATNTGNLALTDVVIADPLIEDQPAVLNCIPAQPAALAPAEQLVCTGSYLVSQNDLDAGPNIVNIATVVAPDPIDPINNPPLGDDDTTTTPTVFDPMIELTKVITSGDPYTNVNDVITYELTATNTGNVALSQVTISDPQAVLGVCTPVQPATLLPGEDLVCVASYQVMQPDINLGSFTNTATVDGVDPNNDPVQATDQAIASGPALNPLLITTKQLTSNADEDGSGNVTLGDTLTYTLTVTNGGNATLTGVTLVDSLIAPLNCVPTQPATLDPAEQLVCTGEYVVQPGDVAAGQIVNTATGDSDQTGPDNDQVTTPVFGPEVSVSKAANPVSGSSVTAGQIISYTLTAVISDAPLTAALDLSDTLDTDLTFGSVTNNPGGFAADTAGNPLVFTLPSGTTPGSYSVTYTATVNNDATGTVGNSVVITGPGGDPDPQCPSCTTSHPLADPQVSITKTSNPANGTNVTAGQTITYTLTAVVTDAALTAALDLSDTLDADLTFGSVTNAGAFTPNTAGNPLVFTLPSGTTPGSYSVTYTATVNNDATGTVGNSVVITGPGGDPDPECPSCATSHPLADPQVSVTKVSAPISGTQVSVGQTITYTLTAVVTDAALTSNLNLSDTLDADLSFGSVTNAGVFSANTAGNPLVFTLPSGTTPGSYSVAYTATVNNDATGTVGNSVVITDSGGDPDPQCPSCSTNHPVGIPDLLLVKQALLDDTNGNGFADVGEDIDYTLTATNTGNVTLIDVTITDPLIGTLSCTPTQPATLAPTELLVCTGSYTVTQPDVDAGGSIVNTATASAPDPFDPVNNPPLTDEDSTSTPVVPVPGLALVKAALLDDSNSNTFADVGETINYTLTATNTGNLALTDVVIDDPLIGTLNCAPTQPAVLAPAEQLVCTGSYLVSQTDLDNGPDIVNIATVVAPDPIDPINNPPLGDDDTTTTPTTFDPMIGLTKVITSGNPYANVNDVITYELTATNTGNVTLSDAVISDPQAVLGVCTPAQPATLLPGETLTCQASYQVDQSEINAGSFTNIAEVDARDPNDQLIEDSDSATATGPTANPALGTTKQLTSNADEDGSGNVTLGDTLTYTLTVTNAGNVTLTGVTLVDSLIAPLNCVPAQPAVLDPTEQLVCTGNYVVQPGDVTAGQIVNTATGDSDQTGPDNDQVTTPVFGPEVSVSKLANPVSGSSVRAGQTISYTLTAVVSDAPLTAALNLSDTLDADLTFGAVTNAGAFTPNTAGNPLVFTLPSGTTPGSYSVTYTATVNNDATGTVGNSVVITGPGGDPDPQCPSCTTNHPVADPQVSVTKVSNPVSGTNVTAGQTITYTLTAVITDAALTAALDLSDTLDADLTFGSVTNAGAFTPNTAGNPLVFTLPSGTIPGSYSVTYTATVNNDATDTVGNSVVITGSGGDPDPQCPSCTTSHPLADPQIVVNKTSNPASGTNVTAGQTITYTLTVTITDAALTAALDLSDTLDADLTFGAVTNAGAFTPNTVGNPLVFTLPSGTIPGNYSVTYTATVNNDASGTVGNSVVITGSGGDPDPQCPSCTTNHPVADPQVSVTKASNPVNGTQVSAGQAITYTLTATITDAALTAAMDLSDTLDADLTFGSVTNAGAFSANTAGNPLVFTLPSGTTPGSYAITYTATVNADATGTVGNSVVITGSGGDPDPECPSCTTSHPLADPQIVVNKASDPVSGSSVIAGETITYTLTAVVSDAALTADLDLSDTLDADLTFGSVTNAGAFTSNTTGNPLVFTLPSGTTPGSYSVTYTATVNNDATGTVGNSVVITGPGGDPDPECPSCTTSHPVFNLQLEKLVTGLTSTGPNRWLVSFDLVIQSTGDADGSYTLIDTLNFSSGGIVLGETANVSTVQGSLNPALASGIFTPQNGSALQVSVAGLAIGAGAEHRYSIEVPFAVVEGQLQNGQCTGLPGNGLFNLATLTGPVQVEDDACASIDEGSDVAINLLKTVELGIDNNGNNFGDVGDVLFYAFEITNTGSDPLTDIQLIDLLVDDLACTPQTTDGEPIQVLPWDGISIRGFERGGLGTLNSGETLVCAASHTLTAADVARRRVENTATVLGTGPLGEVVTSVSTAVYTAFQ